MPYQDTLQAKRQQAALERKQQAELNATIAEMKKIQMAAMMGQSKPSVVLTDQTDLGDKIKDLTERMTAAIKSTDTTGLSKEQVDSLQALESGLAGLIKAVQTSTKDDKDNTAGIIRALKALDIKPVVNLPAPNVTVSPSELDLQPLQDTLSELLSPKEAKIDLSCYRAQDIKESGDVQYVGFVNPEGHWYIIENDIKKNKMRYLFGNSGYSKHFKNAATYVYKLMDKAIADAA